jgi:hypothetical protein
MLFGWYFSQNFRKKQLISPIAITGKPSQKIVNPNATAHINELLTASNFHAIEVVAASNSAIFVTLDSGEHIIFSENKDLNAQITSLQLIKRQLTIEGKRVNRIDFRFDNPVLSF